MLSEFKALGALPTGEGCPEDVVKEVDLVNAMAEKRHGLLERAETKLQDLEATSDSEDFAAYDRELKAVTKFISGELRRESITTLRRRQEVIDDRLLPSFVHRITLACEAVPAVEAKLCDGLKDMGFIDPKIDPVMGYVPVWVRRHPEYKAAEMALLELRSLRDHVREQSIANAQQLEAELKALAESRQRVLSLI